jgi:menaquinone-specific isochorismate synthase
VSRATVLVLPAPPAAPEAMLRALPAEPAVFWAPPQGPALCGLGVAVRIDVRGRGGMAAVRERAGRLLSETVVIGGGDPRCAPRLVGGVAFDRSRRLDRRWAGFPPGVFILPRWTYVRAGDHAWLLAAVRGGPGRFADPHWARESGRICRALFRPVGPARPRPTSPFEDGDERAFALAVGRVIEGIRRGRHEKVVLARRLGLRWPSPPDPGAVLRALGAGQPQSVRFALRLPGATFLGASPERLVTKRGRSVEADALAGSAVTRASVRALPHSRKDRVEHALVVRALRQALGAHGHVEAPPAPRVRRFPGIGHLFTPVRGLLRDGAHVLELVEALHPTPAVAGWPRAAALRFLAGGEEPRGWYAGAFGWFDAMGDGEFVVAIRSGLLRGRRADLWAGAGIVAGSQVAAEAAEIARKQQTMLRALGAA